MVTNNDTEKIINGCKKGDRKAQELLYRSYYRAMVSICLRYTKNEADAVEVLNNSFFKVYKNIEKYNQGGASLYTWIRTIVINSCLDFIKTRDKAERYRELAEADEIDIPAEAVARMNATELLKLVRNLPPATQGVFNLYVVEGYTHKEIGEMLGISQGTSKWHLSEARKLLREQLRLEEEAI